MLATIDSSDVLAALAFGIGLAVISFFFIGLFRRVPTLLVLLVALLAVLVVAIGLWAAVRPTSQAATNPPMVAPTPLSTPDVSPLPPGPQPSGGASGAPSASPSTASCAPRGSAVTEVVRNISYQSPCLAVRASRPFTITFRNEDAGTTHDLHVFSADPARDPSATSIFTGALVTGPATAQYHVQQLPAGRYYFHCDIHPTQMQGELVVAP